MNKTFVYNKARILLTFSIPVLWLLAIIGVSLMAVIPETLHGHISSNSPLLLVLGIILIFFALVVIKIIDFLKTSLEIVDQGIFYKSMLKNIFVPWNDIIGISRVDLIRMPRGLPEYYNPSRPIDFKIQTKSNGQLYIFHFIRLKEKGGNALSELVDELMKHTQWRDTEAGWKTALKNRRQRSRIILGCLLILFGVAFPLVFKDGQVHSRLLQIIIDTVGLSGASLFFIITGLYTLLTKNKRLN